MKKIGETNDYATKSRAWQDGFRNGRTDRKLGLRSDYAWYSMDSTNEYTREYAQGYRFAFEVSGGVEE
jgi:hypothetical protein